MEFKSIRCRRARTLHREGEREEEKGPHEERRERELPPMRGFPRVPRFCLHLQRNPPSSRTCASCVCVRWALRIFLLRRGINDAQGWARSVFHGVCIEARSCVQECAFFSWFRGGRRGGTHGESSFLFIFGGDSGVCARARTDTRPLMRDGVYCFPFYWFRLCKVRSCHRSGNDEVVW